MATDTGRSPEPPVGLPVTLMQPTRVARPFHREGWIYEEKYDGWRLVAYKRAGQTRLLSRHHRDHTRRFPALAAAIAALTPPTLILDGEVVVFDAQLLSRCAWLRQRDPAALATPPIYMVFDLLQTGAHDLRGEPLRIRRAALERLVSGQRLIFPARRLAASGLTAWDEVHQRGYEGLVAKDEASPYVGGRTLAWLKVTQRTYRAAARGVQARRRDRRDGAASRETADSP
jgi:bifunctional non-homologous end joining protein LigD